MMDDFKKSFVKVKAKKKVTEKVVKEVEDQNKEHLKGDFRILIDRLLDSKVETVFFVSTVDIFHKKNEVKIFSIKNKIVSLFILMFGPYLHFWPLIRLVYINQVGIH